MPRIDLVKPKLWDLVALVVLALGAGIAGANLAVSRGDGSLSTGVTAVFVTAQLAVCVVSFLVLGKTAKEGTIWGNLLAVGGGFAGMSGVLLASALWTLA